MYSNTIHNNLVQGHTFIEHHIPHQEIATGIPRGYYRREDNEIPKDEVYSNSKRMEISNMTGEYQVNAPLQFIPHPNMTNLKHIKQNENDKKTLTEKREIPSNTTNISMNPNNSTFGSNVSSTISNNSNINTKTNTRRQMELEAYSAILSAFKVQGELTWKKETILQDLRMILKISDERHRQELKRVETTIPPSLIIGQNIHHVPINPNKRTISPAQDADSSEESAFSEEDSKRQRRASKDVNEPIFTVQPFPTSDDQSVKVKTTKSKSKKEGTGTAEKKKGGRKKKETPSSNKSEIDWQMKKAEPLVPIPVINSTKAPSSGHDVEVGKDIELTAEVLEARNGGNLDNFREALEAKKKEIQDALHQMQ